MQHIPKLALGLLFASSFGIAQSAADLRGIYIYTNDVSQITNATANALRASFNVPGVDGVAVVIGWNAIEPSMGQYQWTALDQWIGQVAALGKKIDLVIPAGASTPAWLFQSKPTGAGAVQLAFTVSPHGGQTGVCDTDITAPPWDTAFLAQWDAMLSAVSAHLKSAGTYDEINLLRLTGINRTTEELRLPAETAQSTGLACVSNAIATWQQAGYRPSLLLQGWNAIMASFVKSFPDKSFSVAIIPNDAFPGIAEDGSAISGAIGDENEPLLQSAGQLLGNRVLVQFDFLMPGVVAPMQVTNAVKNYGTLAAFQTNEYLGGQGAGCSEPITTTIPCTAGTFLAMLETGIHPQGEDSTLRAQYIEVFQANATAFPASLQQAHLELTCDYQLSLGGQAFPYAGGTGTITITTAANCPWTVGTLPSWVTLTSPSSGVGPGTVTFQVAPNSANISGTDLSGSFVVGNQSFTVEQQGGCCTTFTGAMPHLAAGGGWTTTFTFVNKTATAAVANTSFFAASGAPLTLPLNLPQQTSITGPVAAATLDQTIAPNASLVLQATGPANAPFEEGSAWLASKAAGAIDGFAIFHYGPTQQEAVVPMQTQAGVNYTLPFDNTNGVLTGVALDNIPPAAGSVPITIRDDSGKVIDTESIALPGFGHTSFVLSTLYPKTANIRGTIEFDLISGPTAQIGVLGIRYTAGTTTTLPALPRLGLLSKPNGSMAHLAAGNGWQTTFVLVNQGTSAASATLNFYGDSGSPLSLPLTFPQGGASVVAPSFSQSIAPSASLWVQVAGGATLQTGSAQLGATGDIGGFAIFRYNPNGQEAVVPLENRGAGAYLIAYDDTRNTATGIAIANASPAPVNVPVTLRDDLGNLLGTSSIALNGNGHTSFVLPTLFPQSATIRGTVEFDAPSGASISVLGIRSPPALTFTSLPALAK